MPVPICTTVQTFIPIGVTVAEISVTVQKTYLKLNYQTKRIFWNLLGYRPQKGEENACTCMYHHVKFHADRCHRRRDICNGTKNLISQNAY